MCHNHSSINTQVQWKDWWCIMSIVSALCLVPCNTVLQWSHIFTRCTKMFLIWLITQVSMNMLMLTRNITQGAASHYKLWFDCCVVCVVLCCVVLCCVVLCCVVLVLVLVLGVRVWGHYTPCNVWHLHPLTLRKKQSKHSLLIDSNPTNSLSSKRVEVFKNFGFPLLREGWSEVMTDCITSLYNNWSIS